jgi:hypothetical protein
LPGSREEICGVSRTISAARRSVGTTFRTDVSRPTKLPIRIVSQARTGNDSRHSRVRLTESRGLSRTFAVKHRARNAGMNSRASNGATRSGYRESMRLNASLNASSLSGRTTEAEGLTLRLHEPGEIDSKYAGYSDDEGVACAAGDPFVAQRCLLAAIPVPG